MLSNLIQISFIQAKAEPSYSLSSILLEAVDGYCPRSEARVMQAYCYFRENIKDHAFFVLTRIIWCLFSDFTMYCDACRMWEKGLLKSLAWVKQSKLNLELK